MPCSPSGLVLMLAAAVAPAPLLAQSTVPSTPANEPPVIAEPSTRNDRPAKSEPPIIEMPELFKPGGFDKRYAVPDLAPDRLLFPRLNTPAFTLRPGIELIVDYSAFAQDETSLAQVGQQPDGFDVRSASLSFEGEIGPRRLIGYKIGLAYNGFNAEIEENFTLTDFNTFFAIPRWRTIVRLGKMQEDFGYEVVGSTATLPQSERTLSPFASPINPGIKVTHVVGKNNRATLTYGVFRNDWGEGDGRPAVSARATVIAIDQPEHFLHLGAAFRRADVGGTTRYQARPAMNAADSFVDTGDFAAKSATHLGVEANYVRGPFSIIAEFASARSDVPTGEDPVFHGFYLMGSWVLTGERREYDRNRGVLKRIIPLGRWGAPELIARYSMVDLSSNGVDGGRYDRLEVGANWWATTRWKFGMIYGHVWLDRFGEHGKTHTLLTRLQWVY